MAVLFALTLMCASAHASEVAGVLERARMQLGEGRFGPVRQSGDFAAVPYEGILEGKRERGELLLRRYPFGWQVLAAETALRPCDLRGYAVPPSADRILLSDARRLPRSTSTSPCPTPRAPYLPSRDEVAVRAISARESPHTCVPVVAVAGRFALENWDCAGGGQALYRKSPSGRWERVTGGGGAMDIGTLLEHGVSRADAASLLRQSAMER